RQLQNRIDRHIRGLDEVQRGALLDNIQDIGVPTGRARQAIAQHNNFNAMREAVIRAQARAEATQRGLPAAEASQRVLPAANPGLIQDVIWLRAQRQWLANLRRWLLRGME